MSGMATCNMQHGGTLLTLYCEECEKTVNALVHCAQCDMDYCQPCDHSFHAQHPSHTRTPVTHDENAILAAQQLERDLQMQQANDTALLQRLAAEAEVEVEEELKRRQESEGMDDDDNVMRDGDDDDEKRLH